jgi:hypothetical protein
MNFTPACDVILIDSSVSTRWRPPWRQFRREQMCQTYDESM